LTPLSASGLCEAVTTSPVLPPAFSARAAISTPHLPKVWLTHLRNVSASALCEAVPTSPVLLATYRTCAALSTPQLPGALSQSARVLLIGFKRG